MGESELSAKPDNNKNLLIEIIFVAAIITLFLYNTYRIHNFSGLSVLYDEFGYWANAAHFAGVNWSSAAMYGVSYYSFGYSFFLAPLFRFIESPVIMYRAALLLNALFVCGCFLVSYILAKRVAPSANKFFLILICFIISIYPAYAVQAKVTWSECLLFLLIWVLTLCFFDMSDTPTYHMTIIISVLLALVYTVHQRALGVLISGVIVIALLRVIGKVNNRQILIFACCLFALLFASSIIKSDLYDSLYATVRETGRNDYGSAINQVKLFLSLEGIYEMLVSLCGQVYYLGAATFLFFYYGIWVIVEKTVAGIKSRKSGSAFYFGFVFLLLSILGTIGISVISMAGARSSHHLMYGRYNEMIIGPFFLFGFISLVEEANKKKTAMIFLFSGLLQFALTIFVRYHLIKYNMGGTNLITVPGIYRAAGSHNGYNTFYAFFFSLVLAGIILLIYLKFPKNNFALSMGALSVICAFVFLAYPLVSHRESVSKDVRKLEEIVEYVNINEDNNIPVYYVRDTSKANMQFLMKDRPMEWRIINAPEIKELPQEDKILITGFNLSNNIFYLIQNYDLEKFVAGNMVWKTGTHLNKQKIILPLNIFSSQNGAFNENTSTLTSNENPGYLAYGPYSVVDEGQYLCELEMTLIDHTQYELGYIDVANRGDPIAVVNINAYDFSVNDTVRFSVPFSCLESVPSAEFRVFTTKGTIMQVNMISVELIDENLA